jgi:hypothetical protein
LGDLFAATEAVGYEQGFRRSLADGGQESALGEGLRYFVLFALEAEGSSHTATARID